MKATGFVSFFLLLFTVMLASSQATIAPDISGISIQGSDISLSKFKDEKNVLIVFYRMQA